MSWRLLNISKHLFDPMNAIAVSCSTGLNVRPSRKVFVLLTLLLATVAPSWATGWVARHNLTAEQYQTEFNTWMGQGLRLESVSGYLSGSDTLYAALWDDQPGPVQGAIHGASASDVTSQDAAQLANGFRPSWISIYPEGGVLHYAVVWEQTASQRQLKVGRTYTQLQQDKSQLEAAGWYLEHLSATSLSGVDYYASIWVKARFSLLQHWEARLTGAQYQSAFNTWTAQGYRLVNVFGSTVGTETRYAALWRKMASEEWWSYNGMSAENYQTETENAYYQGYRPAFVTGFTLNGHEVFNALWVKNGGWSGECLKIIGDGISKYQSDYQTPGVSLAIVRNGRLVYARGFGYADKDSGENAGPLHRFRIASISKPVTATAILKLTEKRNTFALDAKVFGSGGVLGTTYGNGNYSAWEKEISVRNLLTHTTGWLNDGPMWDNAYGANHTAIMNWALDSNSPTYKPGTHYQYMNLDFHTLGRIIEKYSGQSYESYVKSAVLAPCGITQMELGDQYRNQRKNREVVYYDVNGGDPYGEISPKRMDANGGWIATAIDMCAFLRRVDNDAFPSDILNQNSRNEMRNYALAGGGYGLGWFPSGNAEGHNGCMTGTSSFMIHRNTGTSYAVLANKRTGCSWELKATVDLIVSQLEAKNQWPDYDLFPIPSSTYLSWISPIFSINLATSGFNLGIVEKLAPYADPDHDGLPNAAEAYFGTDPSKPNRGSQIRATLDGDEVVFRWGRNKAATGVDAKVLFSTDLTAWNVNARVPIKVVAPPRLGSTVETVEVRMPHNARAGLFLKLEFVTQ